MKFSVNPSVLGSMLAVPAAVADKHLKLASGDQLKVLLAFFKFAVADDYVEQISASTGVKSENVVECLEYWADCGILLCEGKEAKTSKSTDSKKQKIVTNTGKPTREEAVKRASGDNELKYLFSEIQNRLGKEITLAQMCTLVWLYDTYGLPVPVILMAVEYAIADGKKNFAYIEKVCVDWAENDINDIPSAERRINDLFLNKNAWRIVSNTFGIADRKPTQKEQSFANVWINEFGFKKDMLKLAYDKCVDATGKVSFPYINKVIDSWHKNGYKTVDDVNSENKSEENQPLKSGRSYDIGKMKNKFNDFENIGW